jgi:hypothetical protein
MAGLTTAGIVMGGAYLAGGIMDSSAHRAQGAYAMQMAKMNARLAEINAKDALKRGEQEAKEIQRQAGQLIGDQSAAFAAQGISVDAGTAVAMLAETSMMSEQDVIAAKNNAWREAWGYRVEKEQQLMQGRMAQSMARSQANASLIGGGLKGVASIFGG